MFHKLTLAAVGTLLLSAIGSAQTYYSIDVANDVLCVVNVYTGVVTPIGPLQADLGAVDLAWHRGALYAKTYGTPAGNKICQIVTDGDWVGYALQGQLLEQGGYAGGEAAGLASDGISLHLTYTKSNPNNFYSGSFGSITPIWDGVITEISTSGVPHDIDAMGFAGGMFYGVDIQQVGTGYRVFTGTAAIGPTTQLPGQSAATHPYDVTTNPADVEAFSTTELVSISSNGQNLVFLSRVNGARTLVRPLTGQFAGGVLNGIALRPDPCGRLLTLPATALSHP